LADRNRTNHPELSGETFMRKLAFATAAAAVLWTGAASAQTKWNLPSGYPASNPHTENLVLFAEDVKKATGGKLEIAVHANASLFKVPEIKKAVQTGQAQMGELLMSLLENEDPIFGADVVPFLASSWSDADKLWKATRPLIEKKLAAQDLKVLYAVAWPPQGLYAKKDINTLEDMKGLRFRAYNPGTSRIAELVGAVPTTIQAAEVPQAAATGVMNSFISSGSTGYDSRIWESLTHFYDVQAWLPKNVIFVNTRAFSGLDKATQDAVLKAAADAEVRGWKMMREKTDWYLAQLKERGMKVGPPSPALASGFRKLGETLTADWLKKAGAEGEQVVAAYKKMM
jgi:TRAP-type C4-dicarboxylate transport system substrate-binding protein